MLATTKLAVAGLSRFHLKIVFLPSSQIEEARWENGSHRRQLVI